MDNVVEREHDAISLLDEISGLGPNAILTRDKTLEYATLLLNYCSEHFFREEKEMIYEGYPDLISHQKAHEELQDIFGFTIRQLLSGQCTVNLLVDIVRNKFVRHIVTVDENFIKWRRGL